MKNDKKTRKAEQQEKVEEKRREKISAMSREDKKKHVERIVILHPQFRKILETLDECREYSKFSSEPPCVELIGGPGAGKSTNLRYYRDEWSPSRMQTSGRIIIVTVPSRATDSTLAKEMLKTVNDPFADRGSATRRFDRFAAYVKDKNVDTLAFDEFQHFIDQDSKKILTNVTNSLKNFIEKTRVTIVAAGLPELREVIRSNEQLDSRFTKCLTLRPFPFDERTDAREFREFLLAVEKELPLLEPSNLWGDDDDMALRIFYATEGIVRFIMRLIRTATQLAINFNLEKVDRSLLQKAFADKFSRSGRKNPFRGGSLRKEDFLKPGKKK